MRKVLTSVLSAAVLLCSCSVPDISEALDAAPDIWPDYSGVTVPCNIAPLNFSWLGDEASCLVVNGEAVRARKGLFNFGIRRWRRLLAASDTLECTVAVRRDGVWKAYRPFCMFVSRDEIDPWLSYRLIPPGYQGWKKMGIYQRNLESFRQTAIFENSLTGGNCVNCHTYCNRDPQKMLFHARADFGGTFISVDGLNEKLDTKTDSTISALVYPYWHPSGKYVAFSVNKTFQAFYNHDPDRIEVYDEASDVVVYDVADHAIRWSPATRSKEAFETFPTFSPDGGWLYFCRAESVDDVLHHPRDVHYAICRVPFADGLPGDEVEMVFDAPSMGKSASFPRISPDGRTLVFTLHDHGNFSIWHKSADLWMLDLVSGETRPLDALNSTDVESWHCWSSNSRWMVFSSRRDDGLYTKPYVAHLSPDGSVGKPFLLPQKDPVAVYGNTMNSFNLPEFTVAPVSVNGNEIAKVLKSNGLNISTKGCF